jgi:type IV secretory pathway VirB2 component (pilin)
MTNSNGVNEQLPQNIIHEIEKRGLTPRSRFHFLLKRSVFWWLAAVSTLIGGIAVAVGLYVFFDNDGVGTTALLETPLEGILQSIPFVWLFILVLFTVSANLSIRHTKTGYRYKTAKAVVIVIILSICLGVVLNLLDFGQMAHKYLLNHTSFYDPLIHSRDDLE